MIKDVNILLSVINTALRDRYSSLEEYAENSDMTIAEIIDIMENNGYYYDENQNAFNRK